MERFCFLRINIISKILGNSVFLLRQLDNIWEIENTVKRLDYKMRKENPERFSGSYLIANSTADPFPHPEEGKRIQEESPGPALMESDSVDQLDQQSS